MASVIFDDDGSGKGEVWTEDGVRVMTFDEFKAEVKRRKGVGIGLRIGKVIWACGMDGKKVRAQHPEALRVTPVVQTKAEFEGR